MKNFRRRLRLVGYVVLILLAVFGIGFGGAAPVLMRNRGPNKHNEFHTTNTDDEKEDNESIKIVDQKS